MGGSSARPSNFAPDALLGARDGLENVEQFPHRLGYLLFRALRSHVVFAQIYSMRRTELRRTMSEERHIPESGA